MTLNEWIDEYCQENEIELPEDIADGDTALNYLILNAGGGGGGSNENLVKINCELSDDDIILDKTFAELYDMCKAGKIVYFTFVADEDFTTLDDSYSYVSGIYTLSKVYKYDTQYRVYFNSSTYTYIDNKTVGTSSTVIFSCDNSEEFPIFYDYLATNSAYLAGANFPW